MRVRVAIKSDMVLTLAVDYINMVPGTMVVEIDHRRRMLYIHIFDVRSEKRVESFYRQIAWVERAFIRAFERDTEWHPSPYHGIDDEFRPAAITPTDLDELRVRAAERVEALVRANRGRAFVLCTTHRAVERAAQRLRDAFEAVVELYAEQGRSLPASIALPESAEVVWSETLVATP